MTADVFTGHIHNRVHPIGKLANGDGPILSDLGGVYTVGIQPGTMIRHNFVHDITGRNYGGWGIYLDERSSQILVENNIVTRTTHDGFHQHFGRENFVSNNVFAFGRYHQIEPTRPDAELRFTFERRIMYWTAGNLMSVHWGDPHVLFDRNLYGKAGSGEIRFGDDFSFEQWQAKGLDAQGRIVDLLFTQPEQDNFRLRPDSPVMALGFQPFELTAPGPRPLPR